MANHTLVLELFYDAAWHSAPVYVRGGCKLKRGVNSPGSDSDPAIATVTLDNRSGLYSPRSVVSPLYGKIGQNTKARLTIDGDIRLTGEVASWRPERAIKGDAWTKIEIVGVLQRIGRGTDPIQSALTRATLALGPVAYWPLEAQGGALTPGTGPLTTVKTPIPVWTDTDAGLAGSLPLPKVFVEGQAYSGDVPTLVGRAGGTSATGWTVSCWVKAVTTFAGFNIVEVLQWGGRPIGASTALPWYIAISSGPGSATSEVFVNFDVTTYAYGNGTPIMDGAYHHLLVTAEQTSANVITILLYIDNVIANTVVGTATPYTLVPVDAIEVIPRSEPDPAENPNTWMGHVVVFDRVLSAGDRTKVYVAGPGHVGETAADRFARFCTEEGVTPTVVGTAAESVVMGPQVPRPRLEIFDEIARTDDASIFETKGGIGLTMRTGVSKLNQAPDFTISYLGQVQPPLSPVVGDEGIRNDVTAASPAGGARRMQQLTGPHNVQLPEDDPQGVGRYQTRIDVNPATDDALADAAGWRVNLGTFDGTWYAEITADLDAAPGIAAAVAALDIGDVIAISNLPVDEALDTVEGVIIGIEEDVKPKRRLVTFFCVPAEPYRVGLLATTSGDTDPFLGHLDTDGSTTVGSTAPGASSFSVATGIAVAAWRAAAPGAGSGVVTVAFVGSSTTAGANATAVGNRFVNKMAATFKARYNAVGVFGGIGVAAGNTGISNGWSRSGGSNILNRGLAFNSYQLGAGNWIERTFTGTAVTVLFEQGPGQGQFQVTIDGGAPTTVTPDTTGVVRQDGSWTSPTLSVASHTVRITGVGTCVIEAAYEHNGDTAGGIRAWNGGWPGVTSANLAATPGLVTRLATLAPALVVLNIASNDYSSQTNPTTVKTNIQNWLTSMFAAVTPDPSVLLVHQHRRFDVLNPTYPWAAYGQILREIADADATRVAFLDISAKFPDSQTADAANLIDADDIHLTDAGHALHAQLLADVLTTDPGPLWTTDADDFPFDVIAGGQRVSISAIAGASSPQTFTVQPDGRQVRYAIPAGSAVNVQLPIILAL